MESESNWDFVELLVNMHLDCIGASGLASASAYTVTDYVIVGKL